MQIQDTIKTITTEGNTYTILIEMHLVRKWKLKQHANALMTKYLIRLENGCH